MNIDNIQFFAKDNKVKLSLTDWNDTIWLNKIIIPKSKRGKGLGTQIINMIKDYAISKNACVKLLASSCYGTELSALKSYYNHLGFNEYKEKDYPKSHDYMMFK